MVLVVTSSTAGSSGAGGAGTSLHGGPLAWVTQNVVPEGAPFPPSGQKAPAEAEGWCLSPVTPSPSPDHPIPARAGGCSASPAFVPNQRRLKCPRRSRHSLRQRQPEPGCTFQRQPVPRLLRAAPPRDLGVLSPGWRVGPSRDHPHPAPRAASRACHLLRGSEGPRRARRSCWRLRQEKAPSSRRPSPLPPPATPVTAFPGSPQRFWSPREGAARFSACSQRRGPARRRSGLRTGGAGGFAAAVPGFPGFPRGL